MVVKNVFVIITSIIFSTVFMSTISLSDISAGITFYANDFKTKFNGNTGNFEISTKP